MCSQYCYVRVCIFHQEQCVHLENSEIKAGQWNDLNCETTLRYICMTYKSTTLPTPAPGQNEVCKEYGNSEFDYIEYNGDCFKSSTDSYRTWQEAEDHCK